MPKKQAQAAPQAKVADSMTEFAQEQLETLDLVDQLGEKAIEGQILPKPKRRIRARKPAINEAKVKEMIDNEGQYSSLSIKALAQKLVVSPNHC